MEVRLLRDPDLFGERKAETSQSGASSEKYSANKLRRRRLKNVELLAGGLHYYGGLPPARSGSILGT